MARGNSTCIRKRLKNTDIDIQIALVTCLAGSLSDRSLDASTRPWRPRPQKTRTIDHSIITKSEFPEPRKLEISPCELYTNCIGRVGRFLPWSHHHLIGHPVIGHPVIGNPGSEYEHRNTLDG
jgi:hypothetical protein